MPRQLVSYDPAWPARFEEIATELRMHGNPDWLIEHIGSTAIPGRRAKPIIDLAVRIDGIEDFDGHRADVEAIGRQVGSGVRSHPVMVFEERGIRTRIAHFFTASEWDAVNQRLLRDWLLAHPEDAEPSGARSADAVTIRRLSARKHPLIGTGSADCGGSQGHREGPPPPGGETTALFA